jgi:hypothetical protein
VVLKPADAPAGAQHASGRTIFLVNALPAITIRDERTLPAARTDAEPAAADDSLACASQAQH